MINAMYKLIGRERVLFNSRVTKIEKADKKIQVYINNETTPFKTYDRLFVTLPAPACATIFWKGFQNFTRSQRVFKQLGTMAIFKQSLQFNHRFWEDTTMMKEGYAVIGGQAYSDTASKFLVFPSYGFD